MIGHQVGFQVAAHARSIAVPSEMTTGLDWKVAQALGTIMMNKAKKFSKNPRDTCNVFIPAMLHGIPPIPIQIKRDGFEQEQETVEQEGQKKTFHSNNS